MKVIPCRWTKHRKGAGTNSGESGARNLEAESIRSGAESTGGCVKLKTVTEIRQSSARDAFVAESVYLVLNQSRTSGVFKVAQAEYLIFTDELFGSIQLRSRRRFISGLVFVACKFITQTPLSLGIQCFLDTEKSIGIIWSHS